MLSALRGIETRTAKYCRGGRVMGRCAAVQLSARFVDSVSGFCVRMGICNTGI
jgi:hypothetical protein